MNALTVPADGRGSRILVLARNYPNEVIPRLGLWTHRLVQCAAESEQVKVISPVPVSPPIPLPEAYRRFRRVSNRRLDAGIEVFHPRLVVGPGYSLRYCEACLYALAVWPTVWRLWNDGFRFDLVHAHFTYPDGVVAAMLGRAYGVATVVTEHAPWKPWLEKQKLVRPQVTWAARTCTLHVAVSEFVRQQIVEVTGRGGKVKVVPNVVEEDVFHLDPETRRVPGQLLFVGVVRPCKGLDVLLDALPRIVKGNPETRLLIAGDTFYEAYRQEGERLRARASALGLADRVEWLGGKNPEEVARLMRESSLVVLPSRAESFGAVLIEAMACGTPVVATHCGGPDEIVVPTVGHLVPPDDVAALADAICDVLEHPDRYDPAELRQHAVGRYGRAEVATRQSDVYAEARALAGMSSGRRFEMEIT